MFILLYNIPIYFTPFLYIYIYIYIYEPNIIFVITVNEISITPFYYNIIDIFVTFRKLKNTFF